jgi:hypothetical protein
MFDLILLEEFVVDEENRTARITEDVFDLFFLKTPDYNLCAGQLHHFFRIRRDSSVKRVTLLAQPRLVKAPEANPPYFLVFPDTA